MQGFETKPGGKYADKMCAAISSAVTEKAAFNCGAAKDKDRRLLIMYESTKAASAEGILFSASEAIPDSLFILEHETLLPVVHVLQGDVYLFAV